MEDEEHGALGKLVAKARPRMKSTTALTPVSVPLRERKWVDVNRGSDDHECYVISKEMTRLLRHDQNMFGKPKEQSNMKIFLKNSTGRKRRNSRVLRHGQLMIGNLFWSLEEEPRKGFNIA